MDRERSAAREFGGDLRVVEIAARPLAEHIHIGSGQPGNLLHGLGMRAKQA